MKTKLYTACIIAAASTAVSANELADPTGTFEISSDTIFSSQGSKVVLNWDVNLPPVVEGLTPNVDSRVEIRVLGVEFTDGFDLNLDIRQENGAWLDIFNGDGDDVNPAQVLENVDLAAGVGLEARSSFRSQTGPKAGQEFRYTGVNTNNIVVVKNGDPIPDRVGLDNQRDVHDVLAGFVDVEGNAFTLGPNDRLILAEVGTSNVNSSAFDLQDIVVHLKFAPPVTSN